MNYLQAVNAVLVKLRETEVASVTESPYSKLIGALVNEAKEEVEDSWDWTALRSGVLTGSGTDASIEITSVGNRWKIIRVWNDTGNYELTERDFKFVNQLTTSVALTVTGEPRHFNARTYEEAMRLYFYPVPDVTQNILIDLVRMQDKLDDDATVIQIPTAAIILGAYYRAVKERGEDQGDASAQAAADYHRIWNAAIARDSALQESETIWRVS